MADKTKATIEQKRFRTELVQENSKDYSYLNSRQSELNKLEKDIAVATIGFGKAIMVMDERREKLQREVASSRTGITNVEAEFFKKFGINYYDVDFN